MTRVGEGVGHEEFVGANHLTGAGRGVRVPGSGVNESDTEGLRTKEGGSEHLVQAEDVVDMVTSTTLPGTPATTLPGTQTT